MSRRLSNVLGVDDAPFARDHRGDVPIVGTVMTGGRLDGLLYGAVRRDGRNSTERLARLLLDSRFEQHVHAVVLDGIALAGFNVVDLRALHAAIERPVIVVARRAPDLAAIERALRTRVRGGARKWALIEAAGPMEPCEGIFVQRVGVELADVARFVRESRVSGKLPEAIRLAHLIGSALADGESHGGA